MTEIASQPVQLQKQTRPDEDESEYTLFYCDDCDNGFEQQEVWQCAFGTDLECTTEYVCYNCHRCYILRAMKCCYKCAVRETGTKIFTTHWLTDDDHHLLFVIIENAPKNNSGDLNLVASKAKRSSAQGEQTGKRLRLTQ